MGSLRKQSSPKTGDTSLQADIEALAEILALVMSEAADVTALCRRIDTALDTATPTETISTLEKLMELLVEADTSRAPIVFRLLKKRIALLPRPRPLLLRLLAVDDDALKLQAVKLVFQLIETSRVRLDRHLLKSLADVFGNEDGPGGDPPALRGAAKGLRKALRSRETASADPLAALFVSGRDTMVRSFLARLLDAEGRRPDETLMRRLLGARAYTVLKPYLQFTHAGHADLCAAARCAASPEILASFTRAAADFGQAHVRRVVAHLGWNRVNLGLQLREYGKIELPGCLPIFTSPGQSLLFPAARRARKTSRIIFAVAQGETCHRESEDPGNRSPVERFRAMNIVHAELLSEILDIAPLDFAKIERIFEHMDRIVADYEALFSGISREVRILADVYGNLKSRVRQALSAEDDHPHLTPEVVRLVQTFEDPANLGEVRTIHGLKRYLHQKGLRLGMELVDTSRAPGRTVDILLLSSTREMSHIQTIRYTEFETVQEVDPAPWLSYPLRIVVEGFIRQRLYGQENFPNINVFLFGNEVHYYIAFRNHPAFLRIDFSPPQRGGMIDLQYFGISNYELDVHPARDLTAIRMFLRESGFDVKLDGFRIQARYDKETCSDLGDLGEKAEAVFRLTSFLMDLDWTLASLDLSDASRELATEFWARRFVESGVVPLSLIRSRDGRHILADQTTGPSGPEAIAWDGNAPYRDLCSRPWPVEVIRDFADGLAGLGLTPLRSHGRDQVLPEGLLAIEKTLLQAVSRSVADGRVAIGSDDLTPVDPDLLVTAHPAEIFARLLGGGGPDARSALALAGPISSLDKYMSYTTIGCIGTLKVQTADIQIRGGALTLFVLRDAGGRVGMGLYGDRPDIVMTRNSPRARWSIRTGDATRFGPLLAGANYLSAEPAPLTGTGERDLSVLRQAAANDCSGGLPDTEAAHRQLPGLPVSPGRTLGRAIFSIKTRQAEDLAGRILVTREIRPGDAGLLCSCAGIISTGGSILSHAALMAMQFGIPAVMADADLQTDDNAHSRLTFTTPETVITRRRVGSLEIETSDITGLRSSTLQDGDLLVLDADGGLVHILGQERDALALYDGLRLLNDAGKSIADEADISGLMAMRAQKLRSRHLLEKAIDRLGDRRLGEFAVEELSLGRVFPRISITDRIGLTTRLLKNDAVGTAVGRKLQEIVTDLDQRLDTAVMAGHRRIPESHSVDEILHLRLRALKILATRRGAAELLEKCEPGRIIDAVDDPQEDLSELAIKRLGQLRSRAIAELEDVHPDHPDAGNGRHVLRRIDRLNLILGAPSPAPPSLDRYRSALRQADDATSKRLAAQAILDGRLCSFATAQFVGWKAANLGELMRVADPEHVPAWFTVGAQALREMLKQPIDTSTAAALGKGLNAVSLSEAIEAILQRPDIGNARKSGLIRRLWENIALPAKFERQVAGAYAQLAEAAGSELVALRSSSCDEDTDTDMRAGEYETYLHVRGRDAVCDHLKLAWAGFWSERALYERERSGDIGRRPTGGIIVQTMIEARASGVLQTINIPRDSYRDLVVNAGLGLGEGIVSGRVAADHITVLKPAPDDDQPLKITYITNDKTTQVVRNKRRGSGILLEEALYHQRLRPALEYHELADLVTWSLRLETLFGYPLDLEFAVDDTGVRLLQSRPIGAVAAVLGDTLARYPLVHRKKGDPS